MGYFVCLVILCQCTSKQNKTPARNSSCVDKTKYCIDSNTDSASSMCTPPAPVDVNKIESNSFQKSKKTKQKNKTVLITKQSQYNISKKEEVKVLTKAKAKLPTFPLPPPKPTTEADIPNIFFSKAKTLGDINCILSEAIVKANYKKSYYSIDPTGFAIVTQLERIEKNGDPVAEKERSNFNAISSDEKFSLHLFIENLFKARKGFYRCIVFLITAEAYVSNSGKSPSRSETDAWLGKGFNKLPKWITEEKFTTDYTITALVYEFEKSESDATARIVTNSSCDAINHLQKAGIYDKLTSN